MTEKDFFLQANPDIYRMMQNDTSLVNIGTLSELRNIDLEYLKVPQLFSYEDINYNLNSFDVPNYMRVLLCMVVNGQLEYTLNYTKCCCYPEDVQGLLEVVQTAFNICHSRFIEYFSGILGVELKSDMRMRGNLVNEVTVKIKLVEHYRGALQDTFKFLRLCDYIKIQLIKNNKIKRNMSEYDVAKVLYNWVVLHTKYDTQLRKYSFTGYSALFYGYSVCQGFTALYNALCKCFGIKIVGMSGEGYNKYKNSYESHIWSFAYINNRNTYMDVTWGSPVFNNTQNFKKFNINPDLFCDFKYFDISYNDLKREHRWDIKLYG